MSGAPLSLFDASQGTTVLANSTVACGGDLAATLIFQDSSPGTVDYVFFNTGSRANIAGSRGTVMLNADRSIFGLGIRADGVAFTSLKTVAP